MIIVFIFPPTDIQECYEVTLQLNAEQTVVKEDGKQDAWEVILQLHILLQIRENVLHVYFASGVTCVVLDCFYLVANTKCHYL